MVGHKQTKATRAKISKSMMGSKNPAYKDGRHPDMYRRVAGAKKGDIVHHKDSNRHNGKKSNLKVYTKKNRWKHDKYDHHREKNFKR